MTGTEADTDAATHEGARWAPGDRILWRYRENGGGGGGHDGNGHDGNGRGGGGRGGGHDGGGRHVHICRPVTVVQDTAELLAVWMAPGTECVKPVIVGGTQVHAEPLATRYTAPRTTVRATWSGSGVLKLARPGEPWSVWLFWDRGWRFRNWYVNLEEPRVRWSGGVDSEDHFLDIAVHPDRSWEWLDEDEFAQAQRVGLMDGATAERVRAAGRAAVGVIEEWGVPFRDGWEHWRPDPGWRVPPLPDDWDHTPAPMPS